MFFVAELDVAQVEGDDGLAEPELPGERPEDGAAAAGELALAEAHDGVDVVGVDDVLPDASLVLVALVRERQEHSSAFKSWNVRKELQMAVTTQDRHVVLDLYRDIHGWSDTNPLFRFQD